MHPPTVPQSANPAERALFAALQAALSAPARCWFQARLPGRRGLSFRADFLLLDERGLLIIEVKSWHATSIVAADESLVQFRTGVSSQHPLLQAARYHAALLELFRQGALAPVHIRAVAALPFVGARDWERAAWKGAFPRPGVLLRDDLGVGLAARLAVVPLPPVKLLDLAEIAAVARLFGADADAQATDTQPRLI